MQILWDENLTLGVSEIDTQHKEIFVRFESLSKACQEQHGSDVVIDLLDYLLEYVAEHFAAEEALMKKVNYPGLEEQLAQHAAFRKDIDALKSSSEQYSDMHRLSLDVDRRLVQWFILHIRNLDSKMAAYVNTQRQPIQEKE